jgi:hypothetical protein
MVINSITPSATTPVGSPAFSRCPDFAERFGERDAQTGEFAFSDVMSSLIAVMLSIGMLIGGLVAAPAAGWNWTANVCVIRVACRCGGIDYPDLVAASLILRGRC